jgi:CNT family concentrative nucleoside transporter
LSAKRASGLVLFIALCLSTSAQDALNQKRLLKKWVGPRGTLIIDTRNNDNTFIESAPGDTGSGTWLLSGDTLTLVYNLKSGWANVDSVIFEVKGGEASIGLLSGDSMVARIGESGLNAPRIRKQYIVSLEGASMRLRDLDNGGESVYAHAKSPPAGTVTITDLSRGFLGLIVLLGICWLLSRDRRRINWSLVGSGILLQVVFALLVLKIGIIGDAFGYMAKGFVKVMDFSNSGAQLLFGDLINQDSYGFIFAFQVLPTIIFFSALSSLLYYLGILQRVVYGFAWVMSKTMRLSGAESFAAAANIFIGQTEAPLAVKPYLPGMTKSELLCLMIGGMANIAGGVFAAYVAFLGGSDPILRQYFATHLLTASILSAPAAIIASKMLLPEPDPSVLDRKIRIPKDRIGSNILDAISNGTSDGVRLAVNVAAMLLTFTAIIAMVNYLLGTVGGWVGINDDIAAATGNRFERLSLDYVLGLCLSPLAWVLGTPWGDSMVVGELLGKKTILNEFIAYQEFGAVKDAGLIKDPKSILIATYALCGFSNFASIGIQIGGIGVLAPNQRSNLARFGLLALVGGSIATFMTAVIAGAII